MRPYEVVIIFDAGLEEDAIGAILDRATAAVRAAGGNPGRLQRWGRRRFAYELKHRHEGYYALLEFTSEPDAAAALDRLLFLADEVLRHKIVRIPDHVAGRSRLLAPSEEAPVPAESGAQSQGS